MSTFIASLSPTVVAAVAVGLVAGLVITFIVHRLIARVRWLLTAATVMAISGGIGGGTVGPQLLQTLHLTH